MQYYYVVSIHLRCYVIFYLDLTGFSGMARNMGHELFGRSRPRLLFPPVPEYLEEGTGAWPRPGIPKPGGRADVLRHDRCPGLPT